MKRSEGSDLQLVIFREVTGNISSTEYRGESSLVGSIDTPTASLLLQLYVESHDNHITIISHDLIT